MSEHEVWNELGNLYFVSGMLDQASYAYNRAIKLQERFGLPYSNLAYIKLQQGDFVRAAELYKQGIELLVDDRDKAISWYRLGDVFRKLKNYRDAIMAYQQADTLDAEACMSLEGSQTFLYGSSDIPVEKIPSILDMTSGVDGEESSQHDICVEQAALIPSELTVDNIDEPVSMGQEPVTEKVEGRTFFQGTIFDVLPADPVHFSTPIAEETGVAEPDEDVSRYTTRLLDGKDMKYIIQAERSPAIALLQTETISEVGGAGGDHLPQNESCFCASNSAQVDEENMIMCGYVGEDDTVDDELIDDDISNKDVAANSHEVDYIFKQLEEKIERLEDEVKSNLKNAKKWSELAGLYKFAGMYEESIDAIQHSINLEPNTPSYVYELGVYYGVAGRHEDAINCMENVVRMDPKHSLAHATLSGYYRKRGFVELADQHIGDAMKNYIDDENQYNRACLEALKGNVDQAVQFLRGALEDRQIQVGWILRDPDLDSIRFTPQFKEMIAEYAHSESL